MNILYACCSSCWHSVDWVKYFANEHQVIVFSDKKTYGVKQPYPENIKVIESNGVLGYFLNKFGIDTHLTRRLNKFASSYLFRRRIERILDKHKIDIIHAHSLYYGYLVSMVRTKIPVIFTPMGSDVILYAQTNKMYNHMAKKAFARAAIVTSDSQLLQDKGKLVGAKDTNNYIIQNGINTDKFKPKAKNEALLKKLGVNGNEFLIYSPRALDDIYNIDVIIEALSILKSKKIPFKCMFAYAFGTEYLGYLHKKVQDLSLEEYVIWLGYIAYESMPDYYNVADLVISIPKSDSSPRTVYEAMACEKPVIVSDLPWVYEILDSYEAVIKVDGRNPVELSQAMLGLISNELLREKIIKKTREIIKRHFDYKQNMAKMEKIMLEHI